MMSNYRNVVFIAVFVYSFGIYIFYHGFMPSPNTIKRDAIKNLSIKLVSPRYTHLVIMVIDSFRADFIFSNKRLYSHMPFLRKSIMFNKSFSFYSKASLPTVTMPRLKSLTTGAASDFSDIFNNAASSKLLTDNILRQFNFHGYPIVFYGDNTWLRLFPNNFMRSDGTHSFYVSDYTEVDDNVTRHLDHELLKLDWKVMILHYLGLDHIGHLSGPSSPLMGPKLKEMDQIILKINKILHQRDEDGSKSLLLITGDHGMSDLGSHGGASVNEILTPLILLDGTGGKYFENEVINQVDIASTIATLFGLPIPNENIGHPIESLLTKFNLKEQSQINQQVSCQLLSLCGDVLNKTLINLTKYICDNGMKSNFHLTKQLSEALQNLSHKYNETKMFFGLMIMSIGFILTYYAFIGIRKRDYLNLHNRCYGSTRKISMVLLSLQTINLCFVLISMGSTSFVEEEQYIWYFFTTSFFLLFLLLCKCQIWCSALFLILMRATYAWNRTGVKWAHLEDFSDWFSQSGQEHLSLIVIVLLHVVTFVLKVRAENFTGKVMFSICYVSVMIYHSPMVEAISISNVAAIRNYIARMVYIVVIFTTIMKYRTSIRHWKTALIPSFLLLIKIKDSPWILMTVIMEEILTKKLLLSLLFYLQVDDWQIFFLFYSMSNFTYFSQGNSNNLATLDFSAGMIGFSNYFPLLSNMVIFFKTYFGVWFWCCSFLDNRVISSRVINFKLSVIALLCQSLIGITLSVFVFLQRYHLFIWSVYAPRYLYMIVSNGIVIIFLIFSLR